MATASEADTAVAAQYHDVERDACIECRDCSADRKMVTW